jgi:hypothetical protein
MTNKVAAPGREDARFAVRARCSDLGHQWVAPKRRDERTRDTRVCTWCARWESIGLGIELPIERLTHGRAAWLKRRCGCGECREANAEYHRMWRSRQGKSLGEDV